MASKSLGKISAVLVANPAPWRKGLNESAASLKSWAKSVDGQIRSAQTNARKSFDGILTKFQQLQRALDAGTGTKLSFRGLDVSARQIRELAVSAELIAKPLGNAVKQFQGLSSEVQAGFLPALAKAQRDVTGLEDAIVKNGAATEAQFDRAAASVDRTTSAIRRLAQVSSSVGGLASGTELEFTDPLLRQRLAAANQASRRAIGSSAETIARNPQIASLTTQLRNAAEFAQTLQANLERARLGGLQQDIEAAERRLSAASETVSRITSELNAATAAPAIEAANRRLTVLTDSDLAEEQRRTARQEIGAGVDPAIRQFRQLASQVQSVRSQIDALPATIGSEFVPRLRDAEQAFVRLRTSGRATAEEIENASNEVQQLAAQVRRVSQAQGIGSFADGLDDTALRGAIGNLQALQQILNRVGATAGSDGARQFDRLRAAIQRATREGTVGSEAFQRELKQITQDAAAAAAATGKIGRAAAFREIQRGGDIARGGFDKLSLATQQAAFAIDDFFSATGDFTQKIRAVQNNVTQLAFILGGTTGLFIGLGTALVAQAAVGLFKWAQGSVDAEDKTQALNDALARQKSLVEELKQAFDSLGDSLTRGIFDEATERARNLESQIKSVTDAAQRQIEFAASRDAGVQEQRGIQSSLQSQLEEASDGGERARIQRQIDQARDEEVRRTDQVRQRALSITPEDILREIADSIDAVAEARAFVAANTGLGLVGGNQQAVDAAFRVGDAEAVAVQQSFVDLTAALGDDLLAAERVLQDRLLGLDGNLKDLQDSVNPVVGFFNSTTLGDAGGVEGNALRNEADLIGSLLEQVRFAIAEQNSQLIGNAEVTVAEIAQKLRSTLGVIETSLDGFGPLAEEQRSVAAELFRIQQELQGAAGDDGRFGTADDTLTRNDIQERQRQLDALQNQSSALESAVRSTEAFSNALDRLAGDLADTVLGEAQSAEQQARRDVNRLQAELNTLPADATPRERLNATARLRNAQQRQAELAASADDIATRRRQLAGRQAFEVEQFQQRARAGNLGDDLQRQIRARDAIQGRIDAGQNVASDERARLAELTASIADAFENSLAGVQLAAEADALDVRRQEVDAGFQRAQQQAEDRQRSVDSGLELIRSPEQTAAQRGLDQFNDAINGALSLVASELNSIAPNLPQLDDGLISLQELGTLFSQFPNQIGGIREQFLANLQQARDNITENVAAQIAQFDLERSRPSRQALQAQDINTQQGRAELNRLLRGDDANRDQPILQGIKEQTAVLKLIDQRIDEVNRVVGVAGA